MMIHLLTNRAALDYHSLYCNSGENCTNTCMDEGDWTKRMLIRPTCIYATLILFYAEEAVIVALEFSEDFASSRIRKEFQFCV